MCKALRLCGSPGSGGASDQFLTWQWGDQGQRPVAQRSGTTASRVTLQLVTICRVRSGDGGLAEECSAGRKALVQLVFWELLLVYC